MRILLDTHILLWSFMDVPRLGEHSDLIADPMKDVFVSVVSLFEIAVKVRSGKLRADMKELIDGIDLQGFQLLPLTERHIAALEKLPVHPDHKDPFDHQLIAQAIAEDLTFLSFDRHAGRYPVKRLA